MTTTERLDCGDNSCRSPERSRGGMRTNGGCRCDLEEVARAHERMAAGLRRLPSHAAHERQRLMTYDYLLDQFEAAALAAIDDTGHDSWCAVKGRCNSCDPLDPVVDLLKTHGRTKPSEKLEAQRADRDEWKRLDPSATPTDERGGR